MRSVMVFVIGAFVATTGCSASSSRVEVAGQQETAEAAAQESIPPPERAWLEREHPLVEALSLDVPMDDGEGEVSLLPFSFDAVPIETWRYDACVGSGTCRERVVPQPSGGPEAPAVGMRWEDANGYCVTRGLAAQNPYQAHAIHSSVEQDQWPQVVLPDIDATEIVAAGFRCVRVRE